jgi:hypothetical protein
MALPYKLKTYFHEQVALILAGAYWNCLLSAGTIAGLLLEDGRSPWIGSLRKVEVRGADVFHAPLIPLTCRPTRAWTTHYVCVDGSVVYDPVALRPMRLDCYSKTVFGEALTIDTYVGEDGISSYLAARSSGAHLRL